MTLGPDERALALLGGEVLDGPRLRMLCTAVRDLMGADSDAQLTAGLLEHGVSITEALGAWVTLVDPPEDLVLVASTGIPEPLVERWRRVALGAKSPLTDAIRQQHTLAVPSRSRMRTHYPEDVLPDDPPHAVVAVPLLEEGEPLGALGLRLDVASTQEFDAADLAAAAELGDVAASGLSQARGREELRRAVDQLQTALETRIVIEQAKGVLAERHRLGVDAAFERLRSASRSARRRIHDLAAEIVDGVDSAAARPGS